MYQRMVCRRQIVTFLEIERLMALDVLLFSTRLFVITFSIHICGAINAALVVNSKGTLDCGRFSVFFLIILWFYLPGIACSIFKYPAIFVNWKLLVVVAGIFDVWRSLCTNILHRLANNLRFGGFYSKSFLPMLQLYIRAAAVEVAKVHV